MTNNPIPLDEGRVYLFAAPAKISAQINRELLVVFTAVPVKMAGAVLFEMEAPLKELPERLNLIFEKFTADLKVPVAQLRIKLFGMSNVNRLVLQICREWLAKQALQVVSEDLGRNVARSLTIDCETGLVGVGYAEGFTLPTAGLLSPGSASSRASEVHENTVLVLSNNRVSRQLCQQAIEELPHFKAQIPERPFDTLVATAVEKFPWRCVLLFEDLGKGKPIENWITQVTGRFPQARIIWVGKKSRKFSYLTTIGPLQPQSLKKFKKEMKTQLLLPPPAIEVPVSEVLAFPRPKKRRRS